MAMSRAGQVVNILKKSNFPNQQNRPITTMQNNLTQNIPFKGRAPVNTQPNPRPQFTPVQPGVMRNNATGQAQRTVTGNAPRERFNAGARRVYNDLMQGNERIDRGERRFINQFERSMGNGGQVRDRVRRPKTGGPVREGDPISDGNTPSQGTPGDWGVSNPSPTEPQAPEEIPPIEDIIGTQPVDEETGDFRGIRDFETDFRTDPVFEAALKQGQTEMDRLLAARGLRNSGAEVEATSDLLGNLTTGLGNRYLDIAREDASRFDNQQESESNRLERREDAQWGRYRDVLENMLNQNPMQYAYPGTQQYNQLLGQRGDAKAKRRADKYQRVQGPSGGGGGGSGPGPFIPPYPSGPYTGDIELAKRLGQGGGQQDWWNSIIDLGGNLLGSLF